MQRNVQRKGKQLYLLITLLPLLLAMTTKGFTQNLSLSFKKASLEKVFREIEKKVPQRFVYTRDMMDQSKPVTINAKNLPLRSVLDLVFSDQPLVYQLEDQFIKVKYKDAVSSPPVLDFDITGRVLSENFEPVPGATVTARAAQKTVLADEAGNFTIHGLLPNEVLVISSIGYLSKTINLTGPAVLEIRLAVSVKALDETIVMAYGTTTRRLNTGNIGRLSAQQIAEQPVANPLAALEGRIPGLVVTSTTGLPGSQFKLELRGKTSVGSVSPIFPVSNDPLIIVDGIPYPANNATVNRITSALGTADLSGGLSPLASLNPGDIESIEVLKDADATSIYGSRGANGVIPISTKKGKAGKTNFTFDAWSGISTITRSVPMLNTSQYIQMRKEGFQNDNIIATPANAPDLMIYDTARYTNYVDYFIGGKAHSSNLQGSLSGGNATTQFLIGSSFHKETTVYPGSYGDTKSTTHFSITNTANQKFSITLTGTYGWDDNKLPALDFTSATRIAPNTPAFYDSTGNIVWEYKSFHFGNPMGSLLKQYTSITKNLLSSANIRYSILPSLQFKTSLGYNFLNVNEKRLDPLASEDPFFGTTAATSQIGVSQYDSWIIEPQLLYNKTLAKTKWQGLVGGTLQSTENESMLTVGTGFTSDDLLNSISAAQVQTVSNFKKEYRYEALFGRLTYNWNDRYLFNLNARRDGSSRFGEGKRFANFGSIGAAWIFSKEKWFRQIKFLDHAKLRASYGTSGNDKIQDYQYLDKWRVLSGTSYTGVVGLTPSQLYNPDYHWERNRKKEIALEAEMFQHRLLFSLAYYDNRSDNQLIQYALPAQTGFLSVTSNFPALVENSGFEIEVNTTNVHGHHLTWNTSMNFTLPKNKLLAFPDLATSSYSKDLVIGQPLSARGGYRFIGLGSNGVYQFQDVNADGIINSKDRVKDITNLDQKFYGSFRNELSWKSLALNLFFEFRKQQGPNYIYYALLPAGTMFNQPSYVLQRWSKPGDVTTTQKFTTTTGTPAYDAFNLLKDGADISYTDASYLRLKTLAFSYTLPLRWAKRLSTESIRFYLQGQNLLTLTNYKGADPETQLLLSLPPLKTFVGGIQFHF
jgi:TonB-linked SusC/RagA family outer membrane protein